MDSTKLQASAISLGVIIANSIAVQIWGQPIIPADTDLSNGVALGFSALTWLAEMTPSILTTILAKTFVDNKTKQNVATIEAGTPTKEIAVAKAEAEIEAIKATTAATEVKPEVTAIPSTDQGWDAWKAKVKSDIDKENAAWINKDIGNPRLWVTPEQAKALKPELSSDNPAMVWSKTQIRLMDTVSGNINTNAEAIAAYEKALLPAAEAACKDAADQSTTVEGVAIKICAWPASPMCKMWRAWCIENIASLKAVTDKKIYDFKGYTAWYAGEVCTSWVRGLSPVRTDFVEGKKIDKYFKDF